VDIYCKIKAKRANHANKKKRNLFHLITHTNNKKVALICTQPRKKHTHGRDKRSKLPPFSLFGSIDSSNSNAGKATVPCHQKKTPPYHVYTVVMLTTSHNSVENDVSTNFDTEYDRTNTMKGMVGIGALY
jgi:hypothetical protein